MPTRQPDIIYQTGFSKTYRNKTTDTMVLLYKLYAVIATWDAQKQKMFRWMCQTDEHDTCIGLCFKWSFFYKWYFLQEDFNFCMVSQYLLSHSNGVSVAKACGLCFLYQSVNSYTDSKKISLARLQT